MPVTCLQPMQITSIPIVVRHGSVLVHDLGVFGDDADELLLGFAKQINVDMDRFDFYRYFYSEPHMFAPGFVPIFFRRRSRKEPLTIERLIQAAERGRWED